MNRIVTFVIFMVLCTHLSCMGNRATQIILVVDTDLIVPTEIDLLDIVIQQKALPKTKVFNLVADATKGSLPPNTIELPASFAISAGSQLDDTVEITVSGKKWETELLKRTVSLRFVKNEALVLRVMLSRNCLNISCENSKSCENGECVNVVLSDDQIKTLERYDDNHFKLKLTDAGATENDLTKVDTQSDGVDADLSSDDFDASSCPSGPCYIGRDGTKGGIGACVFGTWECASKTASCECECKGQGQPTPEECDDGIDNNCDGSVDEECDCTPKDTRTCGPSTDTGECTFGEQTCNQEHSWGYCMGAAYPKAETCNGKDNNCDGVPDFGGIKTLYVDKDKDGYGNPKARFSGCSNLGHVEDDTDCNDDSLDAHPNQSSFFAIPIPNQSDLNAWDYNCDDKIEYSLDGKSLVNVGTGLWKKKTSFMPLCNSPFYYEGTNECSEVFFLEFSTILSASPTSLCGIEVLYPTTVNTKPTIVTTSELFKCNCLKKPSPTEPALTDCNTLECSQQLQNLSSFGYVKAKESPSFQPLRCR